jgi:dynein heavy chain
VRLFVKMLFSRVAPSLFEKDKLLFAFLIYTKLMLCEELVSEDHIRKLFVGCTATSCKSDNALPELLTDKQFAHLEELVDSFPNFKGLPALMKEHSSAFKALMEDPSPQNFRLPSVYYEQLNDVEQLMLFKVIRPDKFQLLVQHKVMVRFGSEFVDSQSFNLETIFKDSKSSTPIIFILSPGSDPLNDIIKLSLVLGKAKNVDVLSLGQGQEAAAQKFLETAQSKGRWVVLQNCHLAPRILGQIEKCFDESQNAEFRLWLTSMPSDKFPVTLLQTGIKITNEAPRGVKANLSRNLSLFGQKYLEHPKGFEWRKLLFSLTLFHSIIQERRKFGALGWNIPYEFSQTDLVISAAQMSSMLRDFEDVPWRTLHYAIAEANYGGRVTDPQDRRLINVVLTNFVGPQVLADSFSFSESHKYVCPPDSDMPTYLAYLKDSFPLNDAPEVFGLHQNAEITSGINQTNEFMASLLNLLPRTTSFEGMTPDQIITQKCASVLGLIPPPFEVESIQKRFPVSYENSMNSVLLQELFKYNKLIEKVTTSLRQLQKAIEGLVMMSEELDEVYGKMINNKVPDAWHAQAYPSVKPLMSWVHNFVDRLKFIQEWVDRGQPSRFWISGFFFTQSFLTGIMQNYARQTKTPVDSIVFEYVFLEKQPDESSVPDDGAYIYGLKIEGAQLTESPIHLTDSKPKVLFYEVGHIWVRPVAAVQKQTSHSYRCPVYKTSKRAGTLSTTGHSTNYVITIDVPMLKNQTEEFWIKRGVAMLCDLDD